MPERNEARQVLPDLDLHRPSEARLYDLFLGGKNSYEVDRRLFQEVLEIAPEAPDLARENRRWLGDAVRWMISDGVHQFLDLGCGLPAAPNTHEVALKADPQAKVVYVDNDLMAISHGQALLADDRSTFFADADLTDPESVLRHPVVTEALDLNRPVGIILGLVLHTIPDTKQVRRLVSDYLAAVPPGSYLAITHPVNARDGSRLGEFATAVEAKLKESFPALTFRTPVELAEIVAGFELIEPGLVDLTGWWPPAEQKLGPTGAALLLYVALARKP
ncbi:SAM-dependent methyltransferase [Kribbella sp. NPDC049227]|uniref:SAM-dependent methyltransferase n=1 Tax=Kribbella sp. NPDC049227 TaxID=3364113 RepID=UPI003720FDFA